MLVNYIKNANNYHINEILSIEKESYNNPWTKNHFKNVRSIQLEVSSLNLTAQKFYKNLNFIQNGLRRNYYSKNEYALLYTLRIR